MKLLFLFFFVSFLFVEFLSTASSEEDFSTLVYPTTQLPQDELAVGGTEVLSRSKRATCPWFPSLCEIHCRSKGFTTGFCRGGTCTCRND